MLANHVWTFGGEVDQTFLQPFSSYDLGKGKSVSLNSQSTYNWNTDDWTVPVTATYQQIVKFGEQPVQLQVGGTYNVVAPAGAPDWGVRAGMTFLFPTRK